MDSLAAFNARDRRPTGVMIQVSARCNLGCVMCGYVGKTPNVGFMESQLFDRILFNCRDYGVDRIYMETAWGEPMLNPDIFNLLRMARSFKVVLSTNITPLNQRRIFLLAGMGIETLQLSFCGYDKESYESIYVGGRFAHVVENLKLIRWMFAHLSPETKLTISGVSLKDDRLFLERTAAFLRSLGYRDDQMDLKLPHNFGGRYDVGPNYGPIRTFKDLRGQPLEMCSVLLDNPGIYVDGRVTACGCLDNSGALIIGDIRTETLREMRYGPRYEALLQAFASGDVSHIPMCATCDVPYCGKRMITYAA